MKKLLFACLALTVLMASCKKDEDDPAPVNQNPTDTVQREKVIEISTNYGSIYIWLFKDTPKHRDNFIKLADSGFYNNTTFHRIIPGFMIQGGDPNSKDADPNNDGSGGPGYTISAEIMAKYKNTRGTVAAARLGNSVNPLKASSGCQFYINVVNNTHLNNEYTVFGQVIKGLEAADSIVVKPRNTSNNRPLTDIKMQVKVLQKTAAEIKAEYNFTVPQ
jgi:cyclophilin family peptidyl-prolyl cis-trans isomerase